MSLAVAVVVARRTIVHRSVLAAVLEMAMLLLGVAMKELVHREVCTAAGEIVAMMNTITTAESFLQEAI